MFRSAQLWPYRSKITLIPPVAPSVRSPCLCCAAHCFAPRCICLRCGSASNASRHFAASLPLFPRMTATVLRKDSGSADSDSAAVSHLRLRIASAEFCAPNSPSACERFQGHEAGPTLPRLGFWSFQPSQEFDARTLWCSSHFHDLGDMFLLQDVQILDVLVNIS